MLLCGAHPCQGHLKATPELLLALGCTRAQLPPAGMEFIHRKGEGKIHAQLLDGS